MSKQQRILWVSISILLLTIPVWFDAVTLPGDFVYVWRWTDSQIIYESLITVMFLVAAIVAYGLLRKAVGEFAQWKILRIGVGIWIAMIAILVLFSLAMYMRATSKHWPITTVKVTTSSPWALEFQKTPKKVKLLAGKSLWL